MADGCRSNIQRRPGDRRNEHDLNERHCHRAEPNRRKRLRTDNGLTTTYDSAANQRLTGENLARIADLAEIAEASPVDWGLVAQHRVRWGGVRRRRSLQAGEARRAAASASTRGRPDS